MTDAPEQPAPIQLPATNCRATFAFWMLVGIIACIGAGKAVQSDTLDPDLFWHLRVADQLRAEGIGPIVDRLSFNSIREPWTPYSWLAELGMKWGWDHLGWRFAVAGQAVLVSAIVVIIAHCCLALAGKDRRFNAFIGTLIGAYLTIPFVSFRPVTIAILLLAICAWLLLRERRRGPSRAVWLIVPITLLLANIHLSVIVVPIWVGCLFAGALREHKAIKHYGLLLAATTLACLATPMLPGAIHTAWFYQSLDVMVASDIIAEMRPVYAGVAGKVTMAVIALFVIAAIVRRDRLRLGEWLWLIGGFALMLRLGKFAPMFALIFAPIIAATLPALRDTALGRTPIVAMLTVAFVIAIIRIASSFPGRGVQMDQWLNRRGTDASSYPTAAATYVEQNVHPQAGRLINEFNWGGYLAWRLGDRYQVFLDGRTQLYTPQLWRQTYLSTDVDAATAIDRAGADAAIIPAGKSHFRPALKQLGWISAYHDDFAEVLLPPASAPQTQPSTFTK